MKKIILCIMLMLVCLPVYAKEESFYYDNERVEEMWITKVNSEETRSAHPYVIKRRSDNTYVYCLEPFVLLQNDVKYILDDNYSKYGLTKEQIDKINLYIYYGYGYGNHNTDKWYGVTQYLIWKEADKKADIYFTDKKNGEKKNLYSTEIKEIETLIEEHNKEPNFIKDYVISTNSDLVIDSNINLSEYNIKTDINYEVKDNKIYFSNLDVGTYTIELEKKNNRFVTDFMLYYNKDSQNIIIPGNSPKFSKNYSFKISVLEGKLTINKRSSYDNTKLEGATYGIYKADKLITKITTDKEGIGSINLSFGEYIVKELEAPAGYKIDSQLHTIKIDNNSLNINLDLLNDQEIVDVPDTLIKGKLNCSICLIIIGIFGLIYGKKKYYLH